MNLKNAGEGRDPTPHELLRNIESLRAELRSSDPLAPGMLQLVPQLWKKVEKLEGKVEEIDTVLDHDTSQMRHATLASILDSLIKRIDALELSKRSEPSPVAPIDPRFGSGDSRPHEVIALFNGLRTKLLERYGVSPEVLNQIDLLAKEVASKFYHGGRQWWQT